MPNTPFPGPYPTTMAHILAHHITTPAAPRRIRPSGRVLRRRPTRQQGRALEMLGHAVEYLLDSQLHLDSGAVSQANVAANLILMRASREIFAECRAATPIRRTFRQRILHLFAMR